MVAHLSAEKREYELVYHGKEREEDIIANTLAVPLQPVRTFNKTAWNGKQADLRRQPASDEDAAGDERRGELCNADGTPGVRWCISIHRLLHVGIFQVPKSKRHIKTA